MTGIHPSLLEEEVSRLFEKYGEVEQCNIMRDPHTKESRGFGFVKMVTAEQADAAKEGLQGEVHQGRTLSIEKARRARPRTPTPGKYYGPPKRGKSLIGTWHVLWFNSAQNSAVAVAAVAPLAMATATMTVVVEVATVVAMTTAPAAARATTTDLIVASETTMARVV